MGRGITLMVYLQLALNLNLSGQNAQEYDPYENRTDHSFPFEQDGILHLSYWDTTIYRLRRSYDKILRFNCQQCTLLGDNRIASSSINSTDPFGPSTWIQQSKIDSITITGMKEIMLSGSNFGDLKVSLYDGNELYNKVYVRIDSGEIDVCEIRSWTPRKSVSISLNRVNLAKVFSLIDLQIDQGINIRNCKMPDTLNLWNLDLSRIDRSNAIDLTFVDRTRQSTCYLSVWGVDISKLNLYYEDFKLYFPDVLGYEARSHTYQQLLSNFKTKGYDPSYEKLDKEFREFKYTYNGYFVGHAVNWIAREWWDYGYRKILIFRASGILFILFLLINLIFYDKLLRNGYRLERFKESYDSANSQPGNMWLFVKRNLLQVFFFTCFVFWGLRLDIRKLNINSPVMAYILFQYFVGLVCMAYIANAIIVQN